MIKIRKESGIFKVSRDKVEITWTNESPNQPTDAFESGIKSYTVKTLMCILENSIVHTVALRGRFYTIFNVKRLYIDPSEPVTPTRLIEITGREAFLLVNRESKDLTQVQKVWIRIRRKYDIVPINGDEAETLRIAHFGYSQRERIEDQALEFEGIAIPHTGKFLPRQSLASQ